MTASHRSGRKVRGLTLVAVALLLFLSGCATAKPSRQGAAAQQPRHHDTSKLVDPTLPSTTTSTAPRTTSSTAPAVRTNPSVDVPASAPTTTTTTTSPPPPACVWSNFSTAVTTDQSVYATGQTVGITLTFRNDAAPCTVDSTGYGCPAVDIDSSGSLIWTSSPQPSTGCAAGYTPPTVLGTTWSQTDQFSWNQSACANPQTPNCTAQQVAPGQYQVVGLDQGGVSSIPQSAPATISIS